MDILTPQLERIGITQAELARRIVATTAQVNEWRKKRPIPAERCAQIETATGGQITCETLRADLDWIRVNGRVFYRERDKAAS